MLIESIKGAMGNVKTGIFHERNLIIVLMDGELSITDKPTGMQMQIPVEEIREAILKEVNE